jgi:hypothetical protein
MEDKLYPDIVTKENRLGYLAEEGSSSHTYTEGKDPTHERKSHTNEDEQHPQHQHHSAQPNTTATLTDATSIMMPTITNYNVNVQFDPPSPQAGKSTNLSLIVTEQKVGEPIKLFDIIHDKLMHLVIVNSEDLSYFAHIHPKLNKESGIFHISHTFPKAGKYKMWIDAKPKGGIQTLTAFAFNVEGQPVRSPATITVDQTLVKKVVVDAQSYRVALDFQREHLGVGRNTKMTFEIRDANGKPISNLEPLMAAGGHCVIIDAKAHEFLHVHPAEEVDDVASWLGGPSVSFLANFPKPGLYRTWGQFQHEGRLLTADFTFEVPG